MTPRSIKRPVSLGLVIAILLTAMPLTAAPVQADHCNLILDPKDPGGFATGLAWCTTDHVPPLPGVPCVNDPCPPTPSVPCVTAPCPDLSDASVSTPAPTFSSTCDGRYWLVSYDDREVRNVLNTLGYYDLRNDIGPAFVAFVVIFVIRSLVVFLPSVGDDTAEIHYEWKCELESATIRAHGYGGEARNVVIEAVDSETGEFRQVEDEDGSCYYDGVVLRSGCPAQVSIEGGGRTISQGGDVDERPFEGIPKTVEVCFKPSARGASYFGSASTGLDPVYSYFDEVCENVSVTWTRVEA